MEIKILPLRTLSYSGSVDGCRGGGAAPKLDSAGNDSGSSLFVSSSAANGGAEGVKDSGITLVSAEATESAERMTDKHPVKIFGDRHANVKGTTAPL